MPIRKLALPALGVAAMITSGSIVSPVSVAAVPESARITDAGGINVVPTPSGLGLGISGADEQLMPDCKIGAACAGRGWIGTNVLEARFQANVGFAPTTRLATRWFKDRARTYRLTSNFAGTVELFNKGSKQILKIDGMWVGNPFRRVMIRQGSKMVLVEALLATGPFPAAASMSNLEHKANDALGKSWAEVPTTVLPV